MTNQINSPIIENSIEEPSYDILPDGSVREEMW